jgi:carbonic anhydrase
MQGNQRFVAGTLTAPSQMVERRADVAPSQHPIATIVACADSRVPPELVFDRGLGDLFVVRLAGNVVDNANPGERRARGAPAQGIRAHSRRRRQPGPAAHRRRVLQPG